MEEKDFLDEIEGERTELGCTWKFEEERRPLDAESGDAELNIVWRSREYDLLTS